MPISPEHKEILASQSASKTLPEWVEFFGSQYNKKQIYGYCYHNNYPIKKLSDEEKNAIQSQNARKWHINQDYFKTWSHNMAYVLGFWWADGCIYGGKMFDITQHNKDRYILKQIAKELEYEGPIVDYVDRQCARINFSCVVMYKDIIALGGSEQKSHTAIFPDVPKEYLPDFVRGYFDGDGCASRIKAGRLNVRFTSASEKFREGLMKVLREEAGVEGGSYCESSYTITFGNKDSLKIGNFMYKDNPELFLLRKRNKFTEV